MPSSLVRVSRGRGCQTCTSHFIYRRVMLTLRTCHHMCFSLHADVCCHICSGCVCSGSEQGKTSSAFVWLVFTRRCFFFNLVTDELQVILSYNWAVSVQPFMNWALYRSWGTWAGCQCGMWVISCSRLSYFWMLIKETDRLCPLACVHWALASWKSRVYFSVGVSIPPHSAVNHKVLFGQRHISLISVVYCPPLYF